MRLSATLLYSSRRTLEDQHPHLFATVKANKQLGKKCNLFAEFHPVEILDQLFPKGIMTVLANKWNVGILTFLVILGTMVQLMNRAGGSAAFGAWGSKRIKSRAGAQLPYALTAASVSFFTFLVAGFTKSALLSLLFGIAALFLLLLFIRHRQRAVQS